MLFGPAGGILPVRVPRPAPARIRERTFVLAQGLLAMEPHREPHHKAEAELESERQGWGEPTLSLILKGEDLLTCARVVAQVIGGRVRRVLRSSDGCGPRRQQSRQSAD
jgi:hypothetical protein